MAKAHVYERDHINTDEIIPARYLNTDAEEELAQHCLEDLDVDFVKKVQHLNRTTAIFGLTVALRQPLYEGKYFVLTDARRAGYPLSGFMASNIAPTVSPQGEYLFEVCCQCEIELGDDRERLRKTTDLLKEDLEEIFPGWDEEAIWIKPYFHWEEPARNPG